MDIFKNFSQRIGISLLGALIFAIKNVQTRQLYSELPSPFVVQEDERSGIYLVGIFSISLLICAIMILALCGAGSCLHNIFGRRRRSDLPVPMNFANPIAEQNSSLSPIDVRALELDPVVFEPLPTLNDISPAALRLNALNAEDPVLPFMNSESNWQAHDWFDDPYRNNFPRSQIEYLREVGRGWFGQVIEAEARDIVPYTKKLRVWVKVLRESATAIEQMRFLDESRLYRDANHGNILKLLGHSIEAVPYLLIMENCPQGDLKSYLIKNVSRAELLNTQGAIIRMALDIAKGLEWMLIADFIHGDLAARNCQVGSEGRILIGDYGLSTQFFKDDYYWSGNVAIPLRWAPPETLHCTINTIQTLKVTPQSNIWTFGIVLWEIAEFGKLPYFELNDDQVISRVIVEHSYTLGPPTLTSLTSREPLYALMRSCWSPDPQKRPQMAQIISTLESLLNEQCAVGAEDFESKWEQLNRTPGVEKEFKKGPGNKKSVSFIEEESTKVENPVQNPLESPKSISNHFPGTSGTKSFEPHAPEPFESGSWRDHESPEDLELQRRIERGEFSAKAREKSVSVQDLMILTTVDDSDPESLPWMGGIAVSPPKVPTNLLRKSSSESALNFCMDSPNLNGTGYTQSSPLPPSQIPKTRVMGHRVDNMSNLAGIPSNHISNESTPKPNLLGVQINIIEPTPSPNVKIRVTQPTPTPTRTPEPTQRSEIQPRKLLFKFGDDLDEEKGKRRTSTPIKSPSPQCPSPIQELEDVFEPGDVSPIKSESSFDGGRNNLSSKSSNSESSVIYGADDELGLRPFQGVSSDLRLFSKEEMEPHDMGFAATPSSRVKRSLFSSDSPQNNSWSVIDSKVEDKNGSSSWGMLGDEPKSPEKTENRTSNSIKMDPSGGDDSISVNPSDLKSLEATMSGKEVVGASMSFESAPNQNTNSSEYCTPSGDQEFMQKQMQSFCTAAQEARDLFQLGLQDEESPTKLPNGSEKPKDQFVKDVEAASEELGSLIVHDLESNSSQRVRRSLSGSPEAPIEPKTAFGDDKSSQEQYSPDWEAESEDEVVGWGLNSSIEVERSKMKHQVDQEGSKMVVEESTAIEDEDYGEEEVELCTEFVPSKWNSSLAPSKPAIKTPESSFVSGGSGESPEKSRNPLKKSVSFERKKKQLVYECPSIENYEDLQLPSSAISLSLDWEMAPDEFDNAINMEEDEGEEELGKKTEKEGRFDVYRISDFGEPSFGNSGGSASMSMCSSASGGVSESGNQLLGELCHKKDRLKLDLKGSRGEAMLLDGSSGGCGEDEEEVKGPKLDSGVGSSTNPSPFAGGSSSFTTAPSANKCDTESN